MNVGFEMDITLTVDVDAEVIGRTAPKYSSMFGNYLPGDPGEEDIRAFLVYSIHDPITKRNKLTKIDLWDFLPSHVQERIKNEAYRFVDNT